MLEPTVDLVFNHEELQQRCLNNQALARRVAEAFLTSGAETVTEIEQLAKTRQWQNLARAAHRLKGASDNVAATRLRRLAAEIEQLTSHEPQDFDGTVADLRDEWQRFEEQARAFIVLDDVIETGKQPD